MGPGERPGWGPEVRNKAHRDLGFVLAGGKPEGETHWPGPGSEPPPIRAGEANNASYLGRRAADGPCR